MLLLRVDETFQLLPEIDLVATARMLVKELEQANKQNEIIPKDTMEKDSQIIMYGTTWCGDSRRARRFFDEHNIPYRWIDIDQDLQARHYVEEINHGFRSVPTIIFPDGSMLVEPTTAKLAEKLGIPFP